jgi:DNA-binding transcriptional regulator LsrR (DeoR family)
MADLMTPQDSQRREYLAKIASLYYDHNKTQQEIALEIGLTRSAISRLLTEARERGIVEIIVHYPWRNDPNLEQALIETFNLKAARVLVRDTKSYAEMLRGLGVLAADYFDHILHDGMIIDISWGTALYQMINTLRPRKMPGVEVVQILGATGSENTPINGPILAQLLSDRLGCRSWHLHAPLIVDCEAGRNALLQDRSIQHTLERAKHADVALVGIGSTRSDLYSLLRAGYVTEDEAQAIREMGAVGDVCAQHYNLSGQWLDIDINRRVVGIELETLFKIDTVIGVAGSSRKGQAILGALRGGYVDVLITDDQAAKKVLALHNSN